MFQWKDIELSPEDYQNYTYNENPLQSKMNKINITQLQLFKLYTEAQQKSKKNKKIKNQSLAFESKLHKILIQKQYPSKQLKKKYLQYKNEYKLYISQIFDQLSLIHLKNLSTSIQLIISRHFAMQEQLIEIICNNKNQIQKLNTINQRLQLSNSNHICISCSQNIHKMKNKFITNHILAIQTKQPSLASSYQYQIQNNCKQIYRKKQQKMKYQEDQFQLEGYQLKMCINNTLRNKQKTLEYTNAPVQIVLTDYMNQILKMLQDTKIIQNHKVGNQEQKYPRPYDNIQQMKNVIDRTQFNKKINILLSEPYFKLIKKLQKYIHPIKKNNQNLIQSASQTIFIQQIQIIKNLQKQNQKISSQLQFYKISKNKKQNQYSILLQNYHKNQLKLIQLMNKTRILQGERKKYQNEINQAKDRYIMMQQYNKDDYNRLIDLNLKQKNKLQIKIKKLEQINKNYVQKQRNLILEKIQKEDKQIQVDILQHKIYDVLQNNRLPRQLRRRNKNSKNKNASIKIAQLQATTKQQLNIIKADYNINQANQQGQSFTVTQQMKKLHQIKTKLQKNSKHIRSKQNISTSSFKKIQTSLANQSKQNEINQPFKGLKSVFSNLNSQNTSRNISKRSTKHGYHRSQLAHQHDQKNDFQQNPNYLFSTKPIDYNIILKNSQKQYKIKKQVQKILKKRQNNKLSIQNLSKQMKLSQIIENKLQQLFNLTKNNLKQINKNQQKQQYLNLLILCNKYYKSLNKIEIIKFIYNIQNCQQKQKQILINTKSLKKQFIQIQDKTFGIKFIQLFFDVKQAEKYQNKIGIWDQIDNYIIIDNNYKKLIDKIVDHLFKFKKIKPKIFYQCIFFLIRPYDYWKMVQNNKFTQQIIEKIQIQQTQLKSIFKKLINLHKMMHKKCCHVQYFLKFIGFKQ